MGAQGSAPPEAATLEVIDAWRESTAPAPAPGARRLGSVVAVLAVTVVLVVGLWTGRAPEPVAPPAASDPATPAVTAPTRLATPIGVQVAVLTVSGVAVVTPDDGTFRELELGPVRSYTNAPALAVVSPDEVAVLFVDGSVSVVDLTQRRVTRVADDVEAVFSAVEPGTFWVRRAGADDGWDLTQLDRDGRNRTIPVHHAGSTPPRMESGRPIDAGADGSVVLATPGESHRIEVTRHRSAAISYEVEVQDRRTGRRRSVAGLAYPPVLTPDGRHLLVGDPRSNHLTALEVGSLAAQSVRVPESSGVGLDWANLVVLPVPAEEGAAASGEGGS